MNQLVPGAAVGLQWHGMQWHGTRLPFRLSREEARSAYSIGLGRGQL